MKRRTTTTALAAFLLAGAASAATLPNVDVVADAPRVQPTESLRVATALATTAPARVQWDDRFGVPTFVWPSAKKVVASTNAAAARLNQPAETAARSVLSDYAPLYGLTETDIADAYVANMHDTGRGAIIVKLRQKIGDVDVFRDEMSVVLDRDHELVALSGHISALPRTSRIAAMSTKAPAFLLSASSAISTLSDGGSIDLNGLRFLQNADGGFQLYDAGTSEPVRVKRVYFHLPNRFEPAYYVEAYLGGDDHTSSELYGCVVSAIDGTLLFRNNMTADDAVPFSYRVWAAATGDHPPQSGPQGYDGTPNPTSTVDGYQPTFIFPNLITIAYGPISTKDPWLASDASETVGNNVDAYADVTAPDGFNGADFRASASAPGIFDRTYDLTKDPAVSTQQGMAAVTQLFYNVNFLHDWYYDAGFNEAAANAQTNNYGRGGVGNDSIKAEAQDFGGRNNANMSTPSDGGRPRMQMYLWDGNSDRNLKVDAPGSLSKSYATGPGNFGPQSFDLTGDVVGTTPADGCAAITTKLTGKIAFIDRGGVNCSTFVQKMTNAKAAGAVGVIIGNVATSTAPDSIVTMACAATACTAAENALPPALLVTLSDANAFRSVLTSGIHITMHRGAAIDRDGTIDNQIVAHEWMHYMSNRLVADGNGLVNLQSRGMGEGWSDFNALLLTIRPDDTRFASNATFGGVYATAVYVMTGGGNGPLVNTGDYYGIRRVPYSTDLTKDPLTLKHVTNGIGLTGASIRSGADGSNNSEVHNTGEVWCSMLWEAYAALLRDTLGSTPRLTFAQAQQRMKEYLVASLKITPASPTILEARDAILAAAFARDKTDYQEFWQAFAKRGAGLGAVAPERYSSINAGASEDFNGSGGMVVTGVAIDDTVSSCLHNGVLDGGESGAMRISLKNIGGVRLESTTISVSSSDSSLSFAAGGTVSVPASNPGETVIAIVNTSLGSTTNVMKPDITITVNDPQIPTAGGQKTLYQARLNAFDEPKDSAVDDVESTITAWTQTVSGTGTAQWTRVEISPRDHRWHAPEPWEATDESLISPPMMVALTGNFSFSFRHRYAFDVVSGSSVTPIDGGVIEITTDEGRTWTDLGDKIDPATSAYGGTAILAGNGNAIERRRAFTATSFGFNPEVPSASFFSTTKVNLGTSYAGRRVQVRFRMVTGGDHTTNARLGWDVDDIAFTNIMNLPFSTVTADRGLCSTMVTAISLATSATTLQSGQSVTLRATVTGNGTAAAPPTGGTVDFFDNGAILATVRSNSGTAELTTILPSGGHSITATFNGDKYDTPSSSPAVVLQVGAGRHRAVHK